MLRVLRQSPCSLSGLLLFLTLAAWGQPQITSSPNVVGSGARALGMGGAFIAVADDATAASWNPGGLTQLERPELSLVYNYKWLREDFTSSFHPEMDGNNGVSFNDVNYFSFVYPVPWTWKGRNFVLSLNYQRKYDFDRDLNIPFRMLTAIPPVGNIINSKTWIDYSQRGALSTLSPAFGFEITDKLSVGMVMNLWDQDLLPDNEWKVRRSYRNRLMIDGAIPGGGFTRLTVVEDYKDFRGTNYTFGALWNATERLKVGMVYHTKFTADVEFNQFTYTLSTAAGLGAPTRAKRDQQYTFPSAIGLGVAYRFPKDKLTLTMDVTRREWDQFVILDPRNPSVFRRRISGITGLPASITEIDPTYTVRLGGEYVFVNPKKPKQDYLPSLRAGVFYDPEPSGGRQDFLNGLLLKGDGKPEDYFGFTLGAGVLVKNRVNLDAAYTYRWGSGVRKDTFGLPATDAEVSQHLLYLSTVIYF
ncbi:MAG: outer membrane protein transport protein [Candidatus Hydrogenedentes bacterium]|nr:outer membrane protein transport protein [Candidatus Hydrogenedentota bacterium]